MNSTSPASYRCSAPAKLILTGEHAVLYDCPALSLAIQIYSYCDSVHTPDLPTQFHIELLDFNKSINLSTSELDRKALKIEQRYQQFLANELSIAEVLDKPEDLIICCLAIFAERYPLKEGEWNFKIHSEIPEGRGLGSSASIIVALLKSLVHHHNLTVSNDELLELSKQIESRQHGKSSGLDPATILNGGMLEYQLEQPLKTIETTGLQAWLIDTGKPQSTTGEAVFKVRSHADNRTLWKAFSNLEKAILESLQDLPQLKQEISENQLLLEKVGVVPRTISRFIHELNNHYNAAAKVCGSGAVKGEAAGILLCFSDSPPAELCKKYGYTYQPVSMDLDGAKCTSLNTH